MPGYSNPVLTLRFDDLTDDPANDPIWVAVRNPKIMSMDALKPRDIPLDANGNPVNESDAMQATYDMIAGLLMGWRAYDATEVDIDAAGNLLPMSLLPAISKSQPATPDMVRKLPMAIINKIADQVQEAFNPS